MKLNREELAWAAGFYDGEGHVYTGAGPPKIGVTQYDKEPILRFQNAVGGLGRVDDRAGRRWDWRCAAFEEVQAVVSMLWNFLSKPKRRKLRAAWQEYAEYREQSLNSNVGRKPCTVHNEWVETSRQRHCGPCRKAYFQGYNEARQMGLPPQERRARAAEMQRLARKQAAEEAGRQFSASSSE